MTEGTLNLANLLAEWILSNGPVRSPEEILQVRQTTALIVRKYFDTPASFGPASERSTIRAALG